MFIRLHRTRDRLQWQQSVFALFPFPSCNLNNELKDGAEAITRTASVHIHRTWIRIVDIRLR